MKTIIFPFIPNADGLNSVGTLYLVTYAALPGLQYDKGDPIPPTWVPFKIDRVEVDEETGTGQIWVEVDGIVEEWRVMTELGVEC